MKNQRKYIGQKIAKNKKLESDESETDEIDQRKRS